MAVRCALLLLISALALQVWAQGNAFGYNPLCNGTFDDANATGIYYYNPNVDQGKQAGQPDNNSGKTQNFGIAFTVTQLNNSQLQDATWIYTHGANYSDDFGLGYDVCGMNFGPLTNNTNYRGQSDNGSCYQTFDYDCVNAIEVAVQQYALDLTLNPSPGPNSNLTQYSLQPICQDIATSLQNNIPKECSKYVDENTMVGDPTGLTGYNESVVYGTGCSLTDNGRRWHELLSYTADYSRDLYADLTQSVTPIIAVWMPIANADRPSTISYAKAGMVCLRTDNYNPGSVKPAALPSPTPVGGGGGLSGGAIAGIVVGVVVGVGLIVGLAVWWFVIRKRKARKSKAATPAGGEFDEKDTKDLSGGIAAGSHNDVKPTNASPVEAPGGERPIAELEDRDFRPELDAGKDNAVYEADAKSGAPPVELEGSAPPK